jgi:hypothetical protein
VESVSELSLDSLVTILRGVDGLRVEPGEQNGPPGGEQEELSGAVCLGDDGDLVHHLSSFHQKPWMTRLSTPTTDPHMTGPGQVRP